MSARFANAGGVTLHVRDESNGPGPTWAFVNSLGSDMRIWDEVVAELPGRSVRHDMRGHGLSDAPAGEYAVADLAGDLRSVLAEAASGPVVLVGISIGGLVALRTALDAPGLVSRLVIMDSAARIGSTQSWSERIATVSAGGIAAISQATATRWFSRGWPERNPAAFAGWRNMLERTPVPGYLGACAALRDEDLTQRLAEVSAPALVLVGSEDEATPPALSRALAAGLPNARLVEVDGAGHLPCLEKPTDVARLIREFADA